VVIRVGRAQERRLLEALASDPTLQVVARCNSTPERVPRLEQADADVLLLDDDLHLLDADRLQDLTRRRVPIVLLAHDPDGSRWIGLRAVVLPWTVSATDLLAGLERALRRDFAHTSSPGSNRVTLTNLCRCSGSCSNPVIQERGPVELRRWHAIRVCRVF
jgi:chemotaxis response regulator CheB